LPQLTTHAHWLVNFSKYGRKKSDLDNVSEPLLDPFILAVLKEYWPFCETVMG